MSDASDDLRDKKHRLVLDPAEDGSDGVDDAIADVYEASGSELVAVVVEPLDRDQYEANQKLRDLVKSRSSDE